MITPLTLVYRDYCARERAYIESFDLTGVLDQPELLPMSAREHAAWLVAEHGHATAMFQLVSKAWEGERLSDFDFQVALIIQADSEQELYWLPMAGPTRGEYRTLTLHQASSLAWSYEWNDRGARLGFASRDAVRAAALAEAELMFPGLVPATGDEPGHDVSLVRVAELTAAARAGL